VARELNYVEGLISPLKKHQDIPEIPKSHRYASRPALAKLFRKRAILGKRKRDRKIIDAMQKYGYAHQQIAAHQNMRYSTISNLVKGNA